MPTLSEIENALKNARAAGRTEDVAILEQALSGALQQQAATMSRGFERSVLQGATFGTADELEAAVTGQPVGEIREELKRYKAAAPGASLSGELLGGGMLGAGTGMGLVKLGGRAGRALSAPTMSAGAGLGAAEGAAFGAGMGETPAQRARGALTGAVAGGLTGGMVTPMMGALTRRLRPGMEAERLVERAVGRDIGRTPTTTDIAVMQQRARRQPQLTVAETSGATLEDLARTSASMPTGGARETAEQVLNERMRATQARMMGAIEAGTGSKDNYWKNIRRLEGQAKKEATPLYKAAYDAEFVPDDELSSIVDNGIAAGALRPAYNRARRIAAFEGERLPTWSELSKDVDDLSKTLTLETYDWLKRGLDDQYKALVRRQGKSGEARALWNYRQELVSKLDELVPEYAEARAAYAGPMAQREAQEAGLDILKEDAELTEELVANMSQAEKQAYVTGAVRALSNRIKNVPPEGGMVRITNLALDRLRPAFPSDEAFQEFLDTLMAERGMQQFRNLVLSGSPTQRIAASQEDIPRAMGVGAGIGQALGGQPISGAQTVMSALRPPTAATIPDYINRRLAPMLFSQGPQAIQALSGLQRPGMMPRLLGPVTTTEAALLSNEMLSRMR